MERYGASDEGRKAGGGSGMSDTGSDDGPLVKRLRRGPLTPQTWVRFPHGSPFFSSQLFTRRPGCAKISWQRKERKRAKSLCFVSFLSES